MLQRRETRGLGADIQAQLDDLLQADAEKMRDMQQQRDYFHGRQFIKLTERLAQFLGGSTGTATTWQSRDWKRIRLNIFRTVINAVAERLIVSKIVSDEQGQQEQLKDELGQAVTNVDGQPEVGVVKPTDNWAGRTWLHNRMDARQRTIYEWTLRDSEMFVIVVWDEDDQVARFVPHIRFIDSQYAKPADPENDREIDYGCMAVYENNDPEQPLLYVMKRWQETRYADGRANTTERMTLYYPDRIEKYASTGGGWEASPDAGDARWPLPWTDPKTNEPLGIPVVHFRSTYGFEAGEAVGPQNALNKTLIDLLAAGDLTAFQILIALGWEPVDAEGKPLPIDPGTWLGTPNPDGKVQVVPPANLSNLSEQVYNWIQWAAMATDTPVARFVTTKQLAAEGTQKQQDGPLLHKIRTRQSELAIGVADMFVIARRLHNAFFSAPALDEEVTISTEWEPIETRDEDAEINRAVLKVEKLKIPYEQVWSELGYTEAQIAQWKAQIEQREREQQERDAERLEAMRQGQQGQDGQGQPNQNGREPTEEQDAIR